MIALFFDIEYTGLAANPPRGWNTVKREAYKEGGRYWHEHFAKRHFTNPGARKYGYKLRKGQEYPFGSKGFRKSYTGRKWREKKHTNPLVWSGDTKHLVLTKWRVQGKRDGSAVVIMNAPGLNRRPKGGRIRMRDEMEVVIGEEVQAIARHIQNHVLRGLKQLESRKRRRKRIGA